jgi:acetolactate synthase-1/2/3 large subunit
VHLIVVPIDYTENTRVLIDELREKLKTVAEPAQ